MESMADILKPGSSKTTPTKTSRPSNYNGGADVSIMSLIAESPASVNGEPIQTCEKCGDPIQADYEILGVMRRVSITCKCIAEENKREREHEEQKKLQWRLDKFKAYSLMDERFSESTFENWVFRNDNRSLYDFGKRYCECWDTVNANNRGLLVHGVAGNGKTYLSFAIANELYRRGKAVMAISVSRILKIIMDSYGRHGELGEMDVLNTLYEASLLILDDLGVENKTHWAYEKLYSIIDTRYRAKKPTIITTNLTNDELRENLSVVDIRSGTYDHTDRIYNRVVEMCAFIEVEGESWRIQKGEENKNALFNELGIITSPEAK